MSDGGATRRRLLDAATTEFAAHGIAGAEVHRIATAAQADTAQMDEIFDSKDGLFDAVFREHLDAVMGAVPLDADDLPGYATRLYDAHLSQPEFVRLAAWARLERLPTRELVPDRQPGLEAEVATIADAQRRGHVDPSSDPGRVLVVVVAMVMTWLPIDTGYSAAADGETDDGRRRALHEAVRRNFVP